MDVAATANLRRLQRGISGEDFAGLLAGPEAVAE
jgi:hypothetical protein